MAELVIIEFLSKGLLTSIQDSGRSGWQEYGVPVSGAMDLRALKAANRLVGNDEFGPCFEITLVGPKIRIHGAGNIALSGADLSPTLNKKTLSMYQTVAIHDGDIITFGKCRSGCRAYLSVAGDWEIQNWLGSCSEVPYAGEMQGLPKPISNGREVLIKCHRPVTFKQDSPPYDMEGEKKIRILPGPEIDQFPEQCRNNLTAQEHTISPHSNRMGYRLEGKLQGYKELQEMISSAVVPGTVQVTRSGQLIILMSDAQTTGGYHRIASVYHDDLNLLAQMKPKDRFSFIWMEA